VIENPLMLQLPLNIQLDDSAQFDNFFVGGNQQLVARLESTVRSRGDLLYIWGARQSGKTHLAQALCHQFDLENKSAVYLPLGNSDLPAGIVEGLGEMDLVCVDDLDQVESDPDWEEKLFDLYNQLKENNACLLVLSSSSPANSNVQLPDLRSRLSAMEVYKIEALDDEQKFSLFQKRAANRGLEISDEVAHFLLARQSRSVENLIQILEKIDHSSIALKRKVTIPLVKEIFNL